MKKIKTAEMEIALAKFFDCYDKVVIPNVAWGLGLDFGFHECDLLILSKAGYATEVEIKVSLSDLIADKKKVHKHESDKIKYLYFALPDYLLKHSKHVPERAGIVSVKRVDDKLICDIVRKPKQNGNMQWSYKHRYKLARLGAIRMWRLKTGI